METVAEAVKKRSKRLQKPRNVAAKALRERQFRPKRVEDKRKRADRRACRTKGSEQ